MAGKRKRLRYIDTSKGYRHWSDEQTHMILETEDAQKIVISVRDEILKSKGTRIWQDYVNALRLIAQVVFTRSSGFVLELVQNVEDSGLNLNTTGTFEIYLNENRVKVVHNGRSFNEDNVKALCGIRSSKKPENGTLGYLGIGFKSVFKVTDKPEVYSGGYQFKYDRNWPEWDDPSKTPWHVLPIWVEQPSESIEHEKTTFIIPFRDPSSYENLLKEVSGLSTQLYLFLRWLKKITITDEVTEKTWTLENVGEAEDGTTILKQNGIPQKFKFFKRTLGEGTDKEIPDWVKEDRLTQEYRANVKQREIAIAFALDNVGNLSPVTAGAMYGGVYSFLPLGEAKSGVKFPIQADFLVQPGRDAINYEAKWNQWLVEQVTDLCKEAIEFFKKHDKWKFQLLMAFNFSKTPGTESYDRFFGPKLIDPMEKYLRDEDCFPLPDGNWTKLDNVVRLTENSAAGADLETMGILSKDEIAPILGGKDTLMLVDPAVLEPYPESIKKIDRQGLLDNETFLEKKRQQPDGAGWFRSLYLWLAKYPQNYKSGRSWHTKRYHDVKFILTADGKLSTGGPVLLPDLPPSDPTLKECFNTLQKSRPVLHPDIMAGANSEQEQKTIRGFLTGFCGVQLLDSKAVCREALLPRILTSSPKPSSGDLLECTIHCERILGEEVGKDLEFWVLTKNGEVRLAKETLFAKEFQPERDWETNQKYVPGLNFTSTDYVASVSNGDQIKAWRQFLKAGGVKDDPDNGVEVFAMNFAKEKLSKAYIGLVLVDKLNFGFDLKAQKSSGDEVCIEVKGSTKEQDIELTTAETGTADKYGDAYHVCIVYQVPENPELYIIKNPCKVVNVLKLILPIKLPPNLWKASKVL